MSIYIPSQELPILTTYASPQILANGIKRFKWLISDQYTSNGTIRIALEKPQNVGSCVNPRTGDPLPLVALDNITLTSTSSLSLSRFTIDEGLSGTPPYLQGHQLRFVAQPGYASYFWQWWKDGTPGVSENSSFGHIATLTFPQAGTYHVRLSITQGNCSASSTISNIRVVAPLCELQVPLGGTFQKNLRSGALSYVSLAGSCAPTLSFECVSEKVTVQNVVAATATAFTDQLASIPATGSSAGTATDNPYLRGQWQITPQASYSFRTSLKPDPTPLNYSAGTYELRPFDWESSLRARPAAWLTAAVTERVSPNGEVLQERDPLGVPSTAKFGYGNTTSLGNSVQAMPYLQAHNAEYQAVLFESFENKYVANGIYFGEDGLQFRGNELVVVNDQAHTGSQSALLMGRQLTLLPIPLTPQLSREGLLIKAWVKLADYNPAVFTATVELTPGSSPATTFALEPRVRTGEWLLLEARVAMSQNVAHLGQPFTPVLRFSSAGASQVWIDDVRVQPLEAQMTAYVYDPISLRLLASFDDQHFALRYQYNDEGKLIRKQVETERGLKTLQETHYHTPSTNQVPSNE